MRVTLPGSARQLESTVLEPNPEQIYECRRREISRSQERVERKRKKRRAHIPYRTWREERLLRSSNGTHQESSVRVAGTLSERAAARSCRTPLDAIVNSTKVVATQRKAKG